MQRIQRQDQAEQVRIALSMFPSNIARLLQGVDIFFGDPIFAGLHPHGGVAGYRMSDGTPYTYGECLHFCQVHNQVHRPASVRVPTVVVPPGVWLDTWGLCHEFAHALDWGLSLPSQSLAVAPVTRYAGKNPAEAFAEAVAALVATPDSRYFRSSSYRSWFMAKAPEFLAFFEKLEG